MSFNDAISIIHHLKFNLLYTKELVYDVDEEKMCISPAKGLENHPSFTIGHICSSYSMTLNMLGHDHKLSEKWKNLFQLKGPGDPRLPSNDMKDYPNKVALLNMMEELTDMLIERIGMIDNINWSLEVKWRYSSHFPTLKSYLVFMCIHHIAMHLGQLAAWRRAFGLPSALARL